MLLERAKRRGCSTCSQLRVGKHNPNRPITWHGTNPGCIGLGDTGAESGADHTNPAFIFGDAGAEVDPATLSTLCRN